MEEARDSEWLEKQRLLSSTSSRDSNLEENSNTDDDDHHRYSTSSIRSNYWRIASRRSRRGSSSHSAFRIPHSANPLRRRRRSLHQLARLLTWVTVFCFALALFAICLPSYSRPPQRYNALRQQVQAAETSGSANPDRQKVFIVASLADKYGRLIHGHWGASVQRLVDILGPENTFVSVYENDADDGSQREMRKFASDLPCESSIVFEHLDLSQLPHIHDANGEERLKRIAFLAEVRNRALAPLDDPKSNASSTRWDKVLYLNDVAFDPIDSANLLFNTNFDKETGKTNYRAACAVDFINAFKFYDRYATRDLEGNEAGVPFYPWFTSAGNGDSRNDVLSQTDAVRVKSCWGGMVAFEGKWFQPQLYEVENGDLVVPNNGTETDDNFLECPAKQFNHSLNTPDPNLPQPLRFRSEADTYWDASECCLINADLTDRFSAYAHHQDGREDTGIYMNPYIRVAYSPQVLRWLGLTRRFERLYTPVHSLANFLAGMPHENPRRLQNPGDVVHDRVWVDDGTGGGGFEEIERVATPGRFCGVRKLSFLRDHPGPGGKNWKTVKAPAFE